MRTGLFTKTAVMCVTLTLLPALVAANASALPVDRGAASTGNTATFVKYGHGPLPYGLYTSKKKPHAVSSSRKRGTKTGGPSGGLPGRS